MKVGFRPRAAICKRSKDIYVRVIGASLASLRYAKVLVNASIKVTVLKARKKISGRVS